MVLTTARVGAVAASAAQQQQTLLLLFAQDAGAPASARFLQLCPGFAQPASGTRMVHLQVLTACRRSLPAALADSAAAAGLPLLPCHGPVFLPAYPYHPAGLLCAAVRDHPPAAARLLPDSPAVAVWLFTGSGSGSSRAAPTAAAHHSGQRAAEAPEPAAAG